MTISDDGKYSLGSFTFNEAHATGVYVVEVILLDSSYNPVSSAKKEIKLVKSIITTTGENLSSRTAEYEYGTSATITPGLIFTGYELVGILVNGEQVGGNQVQITATEPLEVVSSMKNFTV